MAFIRRKTTNGKAYHYLVEARRVNGQSKQITIAALGKHRTLQGAIKAWEQEAGELEREFFYFMLPYAAVGAWNLILEQLPHDFTKLSDGELVALGNVAGLGYEMSQLLNRYGKRFDQMMLIRQKAQQLRAKVEILRAHDRSAKKPEKRSKK